MLKTNSIVFAALLSLGFATAAQAKNQSVYTSLEVKDCITVESDEMLPEDERYIDFYTSVCPSYGGYVLGVSGSDLRYSPHLSYQGTEIELPAFYQFHETGAVVEWRYSLASKGEFGKELKLSALIYRIYYSDYNETTNEERDTSALIVVRLNGKKSCVLGKIEAQKDMNVLAQKLADDASAKCIDPSKIHQ